MNKVRSVRKYARVGGAASKKKQVIGDRWWGGWGWGGSQVKFRKYTITALFWVKGRGHSGISCLCCWGLLCGQRCGGGHVAAAAAT